MRRNSDQQLRCRVQSEPLVKLKLRYCTTNGDIVSIGQQFNCKMTQVLGNLAFIWKYIYNTTSWQPVKSSPLPQRDSVRLTPIYCNMLAIICKLSSISPTVQLFTDGLPPTRRPVQSPCDQKRSPQFGNECKNVQSNRQETTSVSYCKEVATWAVTDNYKIFAIKYMYVLNTRG